MHLQLAEDLGEEPGGVARPVGIVELIPDRRKRRAEIAQQIREHLAHGLRLARELDQIVPIVDGALAESLARMVHARAVAADNRHRARAHSHDYVETGPPRPHRIPGALEPDQRARRHRRERRHLRRKRDRRGPEPALLLGKPVADRLAGRIALAVEARIHLGQERGIDRRETGAARNRHERLLPHRLAPRLDAPFIVAFAGPAEARFDQIVRRERGEAHRQGARAADQNPHDGGFQIIVGDAGRHPAEVRERAGMAIEKTDLILPLVDPREVTA